MGGIDRNRFFRVFGLVGNEILVRVFGSVFWVGVFTLFIVWKVVGVYFVDRYFERFGVGEGVVVFSGFL